MAKNILTALIILWVTTILTCCDADRQRYRIGVSQCSDDEWRTQMNDEIRREALFHDDAYVEIRTADDDNALQIKDIEYFTDNDFDLIIVSPREAEAITPAIKRAYERGIPVIVFDRTINGPYYTSYMELDNESIGRSAARYARHSLGDQPATIIELRGLDGSTPAEERHRGFIQTIDSDRNIRIAASASGRWKADRAYELTDSLLELYPETKLIYAHNDVMAIAASKAAREKGRDDIIILGTDAAPGLGIKAVADSLIDATFIYPTEGGRVLRTAMSILKGEPYPRVDHVPALYAVDKSNAEILLRQNELLADRTNKIELLKTRNEMMRTRHNAQTGFLYAVAASALLLIIATVILLRYIRQGKRFQRILSDKNSELQCERDQQNELYDRLEEAMNSKMAFFTNVSHDLRTPLTLIAEPVKRVSEADYLTEEHRSMMEIARKNVGILRRMIEQILDFRQLQNGHTILVREEADPSKLVTGWTDAYRILASKRHITLDLKTDTGPNETTMALDVEKFERIFFNLLSNAFKFTPDNGVISIGLTMDQKEMTLKVKDSGIGISQNDCKRIFDRFYQVDKIQPTGSGIGLSLCKAFTEQMDGCIAVESVPGKGSVFTVRIPVVHVGPSESSKTESPISETGLDIIAELEPTDSVRNEKVKEKPLLLIIDDNKDIVVMLQKMLAENYNIISAYDGKTGIRLATKYVPDLVICDIMMPVMDGLKCCRTIKAETTTSHIPVLILTACHLDEQRIQSYDSGADGFISKPFNMDVLLSRCENLIENRVRIRNLYADRLPGETNAAELPEYDDSHALESEFYKTFLGIVSERYADSGLTVNDIAERLGIGAAQLARKIKALTNLTPVDIIRNVRLRAARGLLLTTERSISEIAYETGFSSPQYFSKCFRDLYSTTPTELRASVKK